MVLGLGAVRAASMAGIGIVALDAQAAQQELNALVWCHPTDPALLEPFERQFDVNDYQGTVTALALIEQSRPGDWDVFVVDGVDVPRVVDAGILAPQPEQEWPWPDIFPELYREDRRSAASCSRSRAMPPRSATSVTSLTALATGQVDILAGGGRVWNGRPAQG
jgi:spermidine/putrescine-binding protein